MRVHEEKLREVLVREELSQQGLGPEEGLEENHNSVLHEVVDICSGEYSCWLKDP